jgi:DegV family protein with EDD domain
LDILDAGGLMMSVSIVTDSVACLPDDVAGKYGISVVPMEIIYDGKVYQDGIDMSPREFYELLSKASVLPTTTAPSPSAYMNTYERLLGKGREILVICPSSKLTHVFASARLAADMFKERNPGVRIEVLDSGTAAGAQGFVVTDVAKAAMAGENLAGVTRLANEAMKDVHVVVFFDTIEYLARSGRVPYILAWANSLLKIKPIVELLPLGKGVAPIGRVRTREKGLKRVMEILEKRADGVKVRVAVQHTNALTEAVELSMLVKSRIDCDEVGIQDFTPVMGVHTGPGLLGVSYSTYRPSN